MTKIAERLIARLNAARNRRMMAAEYNVTPALARLTTKIGVSSRDQIRELVVIAARRRAYDEALPRLLQILSTTSNSSLSHLQMTADAICTDLRDKVMRNGRSPGNYYEIVAVRAAANEGLIDYTADVAEAFELECEVATPVASPASARSSSVVDLVHWLGGLGEALVAHLGPYGDGERAAGLVGLVLARLSAAAVDGRDDPRGPLAAVSEALVNLHKSEEQLIPGLKVRLTRRLCGKVAELAGHTRRYARIKTAFDIAVAGR